MKKIEFLRALGEALLFLPQQELDERLDFYSEMIDDRTEDGLSEEEAVEAVGTVESIVEQVLAEKPLLTVVKRAAKPKRKMRAWEIVLIAVGSPLWFSLLVAAVAVGFSLYAALWAVVIAFWAVFAALAGCACGTLVAGAYYGVIGGVAMVNTGELPIGVALFAASAVCGGLAIFAFLGCRAATIGTAKLTKGCVLRIKKYLMKKEESK